MEDEYHEMLFREKRHLIAQCERLRKDGDGSYDDGRVQGLLEGIQAIEQVLNVIESDSE